MRNFDFIELQKELIEKGIPEFSAELKRRNGYDATARKRRLNPDEQRLIDEFKQSKDVSDTAKA